MAPYSSHGHGASQTIRYVLLLLAVTSVAFPAMYQPFLDLSWMKLREWRIYNWSTFETLWTVFCYAAIEVPLTAVFIKHPEWRFSYPSRSKSQDGETIRSKPRGMRRPSRRIGEILLYIAPLLAMDLVMIKKFSGVPLIDMLETGGYNTTQEFIASSNHRQTFLVPTLHNFSSSSPLQTRRALPVEAPSSRRLTLELITSFIIYDASFFLFHLSLHVIPILRRWHAPHHSHDAQLNPQVTNQLSVFERLGLVLLANFSLNIIGSHVLTRTLFVPIFVWLLVEIHSGMDLPWAYDRLLPGGWGGGARKHMRHHNSGDGGFEPFFCWLDSAWERVTKSSRKVD